MRESIKVGSGVLELLVEKCPFWELPYCEIT